MQTCITLPASGKAFPNFWNNVHFHPTDAVEDLWGQEILRKFADQQCARYLRLYAMFEDMVTRDEKGNLVFDFSEQDKRFDIVVNMGFKVLLCFNFMPVAMAADPVNISGKRYKDKHFCRSKPACYEEWQQLCRCQTQHLVDRYGIETISQWRFHCWNEPDLGFWMYPEFFFECTPEQKEAKITEYCKLYDHFEAGVHAVSEKIQTGGPSCGHYKEFFDRVMEHVAKGTNHVTGKTGTRLDFASLHCYSSIPQDVHDPFRYKVAPESIVKQYLTYRSIMEKHGLGEKAVIIDEWAAAAEGYLGIDRDPRMRFRETEYYAAFYFRLIDLMGALPRTPEQMMICLSGQDHNEKDFDGHRTFYTASGWSKPIALAFSMAAKLGEERLDCSPALPHNCGMIATRRKEGSVVIALYNHESDFGKFGNNEKISLSLTNLPAKCTLKRYRIDESFSNAFTAWSRLGSPEHPTVWERELISRRARLEQPCADESCAGQWQGDILLTPNSVELLEFEVDRHDIKR